MAERWGLDPLEVIRAANLDYPRPDLAKPGYRRRRLPLEGPVHPDERRARGRATPRGWSARRAALNEHLPLRVAERLVALIRETRGSRGGRAARRAGLGLQGLAAHRRHARARRSMPMLPIFRAAGLDLRGHDYLVAPDVIRGLGAAPVSSEAAWDGADAVLVITNHPEYAKLDLPALLGAMRRPACSTTPGASSTRRRRGGRACATRASGMARILVPGRRRVHRLPPGRAPGRRGPRAHAGGRPLARPSRRGARGALRAARCRASSRPTSRGPAPSTGCRATGIRSTCWPRWSGCATSRRDPARVVRVNTLALLHLLDWLPGRGEVLFFASTSEAYAGGVARGARCRSRRPRTCRSACRTSAAPRFAYAASKILGEAAVIHTARARGLRAVIGRFHNVYGPRMGADHVIPELSLRALRREDPFRVYGARAAPRLLPRRRRGRGDDAPDGHRGGVGAGGQHRQRRRGDPDRRPGATCPAHRALRARAWRRGPRRPARWRAAAPTSARLRALTGFAPKVSLEAGVAETFAWYREWSAREGAGR